MSEEELLERQRVKSMLQEKKDAEAFFSRAKKTDNGTLFSLGMTLVALASLSGLACQWSTSFRLLESTRVLTVDTEGKANAYQETIRALLLPRVSVPASGGVGEVQETHTAASEPREVRGHDEAAQEGARVDARH